MPARVYILQRIIKAIAVAVITLGIGRVRYNGTRAYKPPYRWVIVPCPVIVKPRIVQPLTGEKDIGGIRGTISTLS